MSRTGRVATGYLAWFRVALRVQGIVVAYFFNFNQIYMSPEGRAARPRPTSRAWPSSLSSSSSWAGRCPTGSTCWVGGTASRISCSGSCCSRSA